MLAYASVPVPVIMLMARWGSSIINRYVAEAPLKTITGSYIRGAACSSANVPNDADIEPLSSASDDWSHAVGIMESDEHELAALRSADELLEDQPIAQAPAARYALNTTTNYAYREDADSRLCICRRASGSGTSGSALGTPPGSSSV